MTGLFLAAWTLLKGAPKWNWRLIACVAGGLLLIGAVYFFGKSAYDAGARACEASHSVAQAQADQRTARAETHQQQRQVQRVDTRHDAEQRLDHQTEQTRDAIRDAPDLEARYAAYRAFSDGVRDDEARAFAAALQDYSGSIAEDGH